MEKTSALIGNIYSGTNEFIHLQAKSVKLEMYERITNIISTGISAAFIMVFSVIAFLFINLGLAFWLSEVLHSNKQGFFALGGFYCLVLGLYLILHHKIFRNKFKNSVLHKVSKDMNNYELLLQEQEIVHAQVHLAEQKMKESVEELKENLHTIKEDIDTIKGHFITNDGKGEEKHVGPKLPRIAITSAVDFVMQHFLFRNAGMIKKTLLPLVTNALITSSVFGENKKTSVLENLKLKFSKFL